MEWEDFRKHLGLTTKEENQIKFTKDHLYDLSSDLITLLNNIKQKYEMKQEQILLV